MSGEPILLVEDEEEIQQHYLGEAWEMAAGDGREIGKDRTGMV